MIHVTINLINVQHYVTGPIIVSSRLKTVNKLEVSLPHYEFSYSERMDYYVKNIVSNDKPVLAGEKLLRIRPT
jgi:hypothetical protein